MLHGRVIDSPARVLMQCEELDHVRYNAMEAFENVMSPAMKEEFSYMSYEKKTTFILTVMNCDYIPEWNEIYDKMSEAVHKIYSERKKLYEIGASELE